MLVVLKKIGQLFLLLVILFALIGVNVKQFHCCHADNLHWEICWAPDDIPVSCEDGCMEKGCCGKRSCHPVAQYDFYKVTDFSQIESEPTILLFPIDFSNGWETCLLEKEIVQVKSGILKSKWPDGRLSRSQLGVYIC